MFRALLSLVVCVLFSFSAFAQEGTVLYNAPATISFTVEGVADNLFSRAEFVPASGMDCQEIDTHNTYTSYEFSDSTLQYDSVPRHLTYIFVGLPLNAEDIVVTYHTCIGY